jgi:hypothetical protein
MYLYIHVLDFGAQPLYNSIAYPALTASEIGSDASGKAAIDANHFVKIDNKFVYKYHLDVPGNEPQGTTGLFLPLGNESIPLPRLCSPPPTPPAAPPPSPPVLGVQWANISCGVEILTQNLDGVHRPLYANIEDNKVSDGPALFASVARMLIPNSDTYAHYNDNWIYVYFDDTTIEDRSVTSSWFLITKEGGLLSDPCSLNSPKQPPPTSPSPLAPPPRPPPSPPPYA